MLWSLFAFLLGAASVVLGAWVLWQLLWLVLDGAAVASAVIRTVRLGFEWPKAEATVTAVHPGANAADGTISVAFDLPRGGSVAAMLPKFAPSLRVRNENGPRTFVRSIRTVFLPLAGNHAIGSKVAIVFDPTDPRRAEHRMGIAMGAATLVAEGMLLFTLLSAGLGAVAMLMDFLPSP